MQRLVKPTDYVLTDILGRPSYTIPWEPRLCPGNPADDPEEGAALYNAFVQAQANGQSIPTPQQQVADLIDWTLATPGEAARQLAADLAAAYLGTFRFGLEGLAHWDLQTKDFRALLVFHNDDLRTLPAARVMALRNRSSQRAE
ncbi:hypothetical protein IFR09_19795 [Pseudomonas syringae]|nr:hypothetical protein [Pseudomonas syringae]MBD8574310.1 hypothetical protein [Pseudomonas syringae]MBD8791943.1 hypothetical protein [Pseudomonas syringae]MBD8801167.1 hypothetical protein [Pseudomonas syringae]MBD8813408.1 hypothetical protein [Pseudomonas syringae]